MMNSSQKNYYIVDILVIIEKNSSRSMIRENYKKKLQNKSYCLSFFLNNPK